MKATKVMLAAMLVGTAGVLSMIIIEESSVAQQSLPKTSSQLRVEGEMPSLDGAIDWLNSRPLTKADLRGKVVLIDFWTYSCINWRRTLPYVRAWAEKYKEQGLVVIGVHSPEFEFEKSADNVRSVPVRSLTFYTGHIIDTLALKGFGAHSTRLVSSSKKPRS
jgi:thiol-disulfide isomerase/thioredoxin